RGGRSSDKKGDDAQAPAGPQKKSWAGAAGINALQQSRMRSGSHPQIRHLAMEGHVGPVTKATMEEIRRDASSSTSNLKINSLNFLPTSSSSRPAPERASLDSSIGEIDRRHAIDPHAPDGRSARAPLSWTAEGASSNAAPPDVHREAEFPPRTTSAVLMSPAPPHIDTTSPEVQRSRSPLHSATAAVDSSRAHSPATAPVLATAPPVASPQHPSPLTQSFPSLAGVESHKRVISEKIKSLATRFSNSNLRETFEHLPAAIKRRPSNTPSVSERVSQFDNQEVLTNDPRSFALFGRFGMASGNAGPTFSPASGPGPALGHGSVSGSSKHSRSSSIAGSAALNGLSSSHAERNASPMMAHTALSSEPAAPYSRRPQSMVYTGNPVLGSDSTSAFGSMRSKSSRGSSGGVTEAAKHNTTSFVNDFELEDSEEEESVSEYRPSLQGKIRLDHQATIAAGVHLNFSRSPSEADTSSQHTTTGSAGYRDMYDGVLPRRRGSLHSTFNIDEGSQPPASNRTSSSSAAMAAATASLAELQRSISASGHKSEGVSRARSLRQTLQQGQQQQQQQQQQQEPEDEEEEQPQPQPQPQLTATRSFRSKRDISDDPPAKEGNADSNGNSTNPRSNNAEYSNSSDNSNNSPSDADTLFSRLAAALKLSSKPLDAVFSTASSGNVDSAASLVQNMLGSADSSRALSPAEHERCAFEAAALKQRLQAARSRLTSELRTRDTAKAAADANGKGSSNGVGIFNKSKHASNAQLNEDLEYATSRVQQTEADIAEQDAKLRVVEAALQAHQAAVLSAAVRTLVAEAMHSRDEAQLQRQYVQTTIDQAAREKLRIQQESSEAEQRLEAQVRALQSENQGVASESQVARHSASLSIERLTGELTVLREQKLAAEQRAAAMEARVDDALLSAQEAQQTADSATTRLEEVRAEAEASRQCIDALTEGLRSLAAPLRVIGSVHDSTEKLRTLAVEDAVSASTPPATPTLALKSGPVQPVLTIDSLDSPSLEMRSAEQVTAAMGLLSATVSGCASLCTEAMRIGDAHGRLQRDLATERRLREAQGLAIGNQREKISRMDQEIKDSAELLAKQNRESEQRWGDERQRLLDNIERLTQDVNTLRSEPVAVVGSIEPVTPPPQLSSAEEAELRGRIAHLETQLQQQAKREAVLSAQVSGSGLESKETALGDYMRKLRDASALLTSAAATAVEGNMEDSNSRALSAPPNAPRRLSRRRSLSALGDMRAATLDPAQTAAKDACVPATADAQTMTETIVNAAVSAVSADDGVNQMLLAYSEKLMSKEDSLRNREDELEAIRALAVELEATLQGLLPASKPSYGSLGRTSLNTSPPMASTMRSYASLAQQHSLPKPSSTNGSIRNRSASFFQGLRTNYLGLGDSPEVSAMPPAALLAIHTDAQSLASASRSLSASVDGSPKIPERPKAIHSAPTKLTAADGVPQLIRGLIPLAQMAAAEVSRLKHLIYDLEAQARETRMELFDTQEKLSNLRAYCSQRAKQEEAVQEDITHVLAQISRLRIRVVELEADKARYEAEADQLRAKCREMGDRTAEHVLDLIVNRVGESPWAQEKRTSTDTAVAAASAEGQSAEAGNKVPARFANASRISVSHPEAGDIRAEFNELLHQVISRRDEDIERMQALTDAWRADARKAARANEAKAWSTSSRGIQTV
ncbi:hypothetical protein IWW45_006842, partial [Coemansia sp. RSA 485]